MRVTRLLSCLLLSSSVVMSFLAVAEQDGISTPSGQACRAEIQKLCGSAKAGGGHYRQCLEQQHDALSPACRQQIAERKDRIQKKAEVCRADVEQFCQDIEPGGGRVVRCLRENESKLSPPCRDGLARHGTRSRDRREPQS